MYANRLPKTNDFKTVIIKPFNPFPTPWNSIVEMTPNGTVIMYKQIIESADAILGAKSELASVYENSNEICGARKKIKITNMTDTARLILIEYENAVFRLS